MPVHGDAASIKNGKLTRPTSGRLPEQNAPVTATRAVLGIAKA